MNTLEVENLGVRLGRFSLSGIHLSVRAGEYLVLLGPTGAGKTVLLECLLGLHGLETGSVRVRGRDVGRLPLEERGMAYVPQDYALFPHLTVAQNITYGLQVRKLPKEEIRRQTAAMMERLDIGHLAGRFPARLSGGEKQRTALGRALVTCPEIILLDEPLSALDENRCYEYARWLKQTQQDAGSTFLHVCHSFEEAACVADRVAVMNDHGVMVQIGTLDEIIDQPANRFVARFTLCRNILPGQAEKNTPGARILLDNGMWLHAGREIAGPVYAGIRPENILLLEKRTEAAENCFRGRIIQVSRRPAGREIRVATGCGEMVLHTPASAARHEIGQEVDMHVPRDKVIVMKA
ncbi:ABC transporter ATP-binding protein [candidate division FCPU426 bacterium]|nr:ABC transporter ATP-binding protein [candidate division FCPU426 bacterium]